MKKKEVKKVTLEEVQKDTKAGVFDLKIEEKPKIGKLDLDFGREDLNKLKDKVNEIIDSL